MIYGMFGPYTVKKEHAGDILRTQKLGLSITIVGMAIVVGIMHFVVYPKVINLYKDFGATLPFISAYEPYIVGAISVVVAIGLWYINFSGILDQEFADKLARYQSGTDVSVRQLVNRKYEVLTMVVLALAVSFFIFAIIKPIYSLTSTLR